MNLRRENTNWYLTMTILRKQYYTNIKGADDILYASFIVMDFGKKRLIAYIC